MVEMKSNNVIAAHKFFFIVMTPFYLLGDDSKILIRPLISHEGTSPAKAKPACRKSCSAGKRRAGKTRKKKG
jgi:hypothetical protein